MISREDVRLGIAPIGWTNDDMPDLGGEISFEQCIDEMAIAKFEGCEVGNKFPRNPEVLRSTLESRALSIASAWFSTFFTTNEYDRTCFSFLEHRDFLYEMGAKVIVVSEAGKSIQSQIRTPLHKYKPNFDDEDWKKLVIGLHRLGKLAVEKNMSVVYHHHMGTGVQTFEEIRKLMRLTDPDLVYLLLDTGHIAFAGGDPVEMINEFGYRIRHVHLKDLRKEQLEKSLKDDLSFMDSVKLGIFTVPGDGMIDFVPIVNALSNTNYKGWLIVEAEQDPKLATPLHCAVKAREYLFRILGF